VQQGPQLIWNQSLYAAFIAKRNSGNGNLKKASEYRDHAEECRILARSALTSEHKAILENMGRTWEMLAKSREERLQREQRLMHLGQVALQSDE
jgi:hypothetical protein